MSTQVSPPPMLDREYLPIRARILEVASALDRVQRHNASVVDDPRWEQLQAGIRLLQQTEQHRAEQVQLLFSREYDEQWRDTFGIK